MNYLIIPFLMLSAIACNNQVYDDVSSRPYWPTLLPTKTPITVRVGTISQPLATYERAFEIWRQMGYTLVIDNISSKTDVTVVDLDDDLRPMYLGLASASDGRISLAKDGDGAVLAHEFGHLFGVPHQPNDVIDCNLMNGTFCGASDLTLKDVLLWTKFVLPLIEK